MIMTARIAVQEWNTAQTQEVSRIVVTVYAVCCVRSFSKFKFGGTQERCVVVSVVSAVICWFVKKQLVYGFIPTSIHASPACA